MTSRTRAGRVSAADENADDMLPEDRIADEVTRPRTGAKRTVLHSIRLIPSYFRLLTGLMRDSRVSRIDRLFVVAALVYVLSPLDFIPDFIPFLGQVDDIFLVVLSLQRLMDNAGTDVLLDHWAGDPMELTPSRLARVIGAAGFFLPARIRRRLQGVVGRTRSASKDRR